ncbi:MAG: amidohydrolase family protein [Nocardioides sp.]|uniref:amidohydrolase family protein n=1 Tax=Nocardioides sp. TaxID=35761 RepID=UPI0039E33947
MIDIHAHVTADLDAQLDRAALAGVTHTVLLSTTVHPETANTLADVREEFARLTRLVSGQNPDQDAQAAADAELTSALAATASTYAMRKVALDWPVERMLQVADQAANDPRTVGLGELTPPPDGGAQIDSVVRAAAETAGTRPLPVLTHGIAPNTLEDLRAYAAVAARYPSVPVVIGAFGGLNSMVAVELAATRANVYLDLSSVLQVFVLAAALREVPEKCLFGSNTPYGDVLAARTTVEAATADPAVRQLALHDNAFRLLDITPASP